MKVKNVLKQCVCAAGIMMAAPLVLASIPQTAVAQSQQKTVKGNVVDESGEPMIGVTISVDGKSSVGAVTDINGNFTITTNSNAKLKLSYVGYLTQTVSASAQPIKVTMKEDHAQLEEVVVVGFGSTKKESLTGAVAVVSAKQFEAKGALTSPMEAMQGQVPGVIITRASSAPGSEDWNMKLRGSVSRNSDGPLVIIDGVAASVGEMNRLNSNDIESINFLKDGSAAIYGSRAADGVVLITTKKGIAGKLKVDYSFSGTVKTPGMQPELMNIDQWSDGLLHTIQNMDQGGNVWETYGQLMKQYKNQYIDLSVSANPFGTAAFTDVSDFVFADTDWLGGLFGNAFSQEHNLALTGGYGKNTYRVSLAYNHDGSALKFGNNKNDRFTFRINDRYQLTDRISLESNIAYTRTENVVPTLINDALNAGKLPQPGLPMAALNGKPYAWGTWGSPVGKVEEGGDNKYTISQINIAEALNYEITDWLTAHADLGYTTSSGMRNTVQNTIDFYNITGSKVVRTDPTQINSYYTQKSNRSDFYSLAAYVNGHKQFGDHNTSLTIGTQYEFKDYTYFGVQAKDIQQGLEIINGTGEITISDHQRYQNSLLSYFGRANYDYKGRYLFEANGRYDGSSKFLAENRWEFFWGASAGWRINEESWMKQYDWLTNLKLRASYAQVGNQSGIGNYDGVQLYSVNSNTGAYVGNSLLSYIATNGTFASKTRSWERINNYNVALDFGVQVAKGHHINGTIEWFNKTNNNMLVSITLPATLGDAAPSANAGKFKDYGWEGQITYNGKVGDVEYHVGGTFTFARNELTDYEGSTVKKAGYTSTYVGYGLNSLFGLRYAGKIQNAEQLQAYKDAYYDNNGIGMPGNIGIGCNMYADINNDGKLNEEDYEYLGSSDPEISYSFNAGASWKGLDINIVFQGAGNRFVYRGINSLTVPFRNYYNAFTTASIGNTWSAENPDAYYAPYSTDGNINSYNYQASSLTAQNGSYLRLKNITIGYTLPKALVKKTGFLENVRIYYTGTDLWEHTKMNDGWDPEANVSTQGTTLYPFTRNHTFGLNITF